MSRILSLFIPILKGRHNSLLPRRQYGYGIFVSVCLMLCPHIMRSQELTDAWTGGGTTWTANVCDLSITTSVSGLQNGATVNFSTAAMGCNLPNTYSSNNIVNHPAVAPFLDFGSNGRGVLTFTFSRPVTNPVLHIDRLGGGYGFNPRSNSALLTLITPGLSLTRLAGNGPHFEVTANTITRTPDQLFGATTTPECGIQTEGGAAGSVRIDGIVTSVSFEYELNGADGFADAIETVWEVFCDFDQDGISDNVDLDDDNDGILDTVELGGNPTLDTDGDGFTDANDLDSDGDGCFDVIEAGFSDPDGDGVLGTQPDTVDSDGLIINEPDGYTTPADHDMNGVYDFQEDNLPRITTQPADQNSCEGDDVIISVSVANAASLQWQFSTDAGLTWTELLDDNIHSGVQTQNLNIQSITLERDQYNYRAYFESCGSTIYSDAMTLSVLERPNAGTDGAILFCEGDSQENLFNSIGGNPDMGGTWSPALSQNNGLFTPGVDAPGIYTYSIDNGVCDPSTSTVVVQVLETPEITNVIVVDFRDNNNISVEVAGEGPFEYSIDGSNYQDVAYFDQLEPGNYQIYVRNRAGCDVAISTAVVLGYPRFFTPNNDGFNDTWNIQGVTDERYSLAIYDRYGKLLKTISDGQNGWDGTYQNTIMPSSDYWFRYTSETGFSKTGHFTLKR